MQKLKIKNLGLNEEIVFDKTKTYLLSHIEGLGIPSSNVQKTQAPFQDGTTSEDNYLEEREIFVKLTIKADTRENLYNLKRQLIRIINPKTYNTHTGKKGELLLYYTNNNKTYRIYGKVEFDVDFKARTNNLDMVDITFVCQDPYWLDENDTIEQLMSTTGGFTFPFSLQENSISFSTINFEKIIENLGDVEVPLKIEYYGPALNPKILNVTTGDYIQVNSEIEDGEKLNINTADGEQTVEIIDAEGNITNAFNLIDLQSNLNMKAIVGNNLFRYSDTQFNQGTEVNITFSNRYVGV